MCVAGRRDSNSRLAALTRPPIRFERGRRRRRICACNLYGREYPLYDDSSNKGLPMAIMREWRAEVRRELKTEYVAYVEATGIVGYRQTPGNLGAVIASRDIDAERAEIVTLSWWKDEASIKAFAGADISHSRYYPEDDRFLLTRPETVQHYESSAP
jgi:heme-degrading monooxygenase HmoA